MNTLAGVQYWTAQDGHSAGHHNAKPKSLTLSLHNHTHDGHHDYYSSTARDAWSCPQGFEPSSGICQGMLLVAFHYLIVHDDSEFISLKRALWKTQVLSSITMRI